MIRPRLALLCLAPLFAACAGTPPQAPQPSSADAKPAPVANAAPLIPTRPPGLDLPSVPVTGESPAELLRILDRRTGRIERLYTAMTFRPNAAETAWLKKGVRMEADAIHRLLGVVATAKPRPGEKRPEDVCASRRPRVFPKYGYEGPSDSRKIPFLMDAEDLSLASLGDAMVLFLCDHTPENKKLVAEKQAAFDAIRGEVETIRKSEADRKAAAQDFPEADKALAAYDKKVAEMKEPFMRLPENSADKEWVKKKLVLMADVDKFALTYRYGFKFSEPETKYFEKKLGARIDEMFRSNIADLRKLRPSIPGSRSASSASRRRGPPPWWCSTRTRTSNFSGRCWR